MGRDERGREGEENIGKGRGGKREGRDGGGEGGAVLAPQAKACPPELFSWRRRCISAPAEFLLRVILI